MGDAHDFYLHDPSNVARFVGTLSLQPKVLIFESYQYMEGKIRRRIRKKVGGGWGAVTFWWLNEKNYEVFNHGVSMYNAYNLNWFLEETLRKVKL